MNDHPDWETLVHVGCEDTGATLLYRYNRSMVQPAPVPPRHPSAQELWRLATLPRPEVTC
jgi:hypothetical protein